MTFSETAENSELWELPCLDFPWNAEFEAHDDDDCDYLSPFFEPVSSSGREVVHADHVQVSAASRSWIQSFELKIDGFSMTESDEAEIFDHDNSYLSEDVSLWPKRRRLLFNEHGSVGFSTPEFSKKLELDSSCLHSTPDQTLWPLLGTSVNEGDREIFLSEAEVCPWLNEIDISPEHHLDENLIALTREETQSICDAQPPAYVPITTVGNSCQITNSDLNTDAIGPKTPDLFRSKSPKEPQEVEIKSVSYTSDTSCGEKAPKTSKMYCQPFTILKSQGVNINDINEFLRRPSSPLAQCSEAANVLNSACARDMTVGLFGQPVVSRTRIITETKGTLTVIRTANY